MDRPTVTVAPGGRQSDPALPLVTVDLDGVLAAPPFSWNLTAHGPALPGNSVVGAAFIRRCLWPAEAVRYIGRRAMPGARSFLATCAPSVRLVVVSARGTPSLGWTRRWLRRAGLLTYLDGIALRSDPCQPSHAFKAEAVLALNAIRHVDDDGRTAVYVHHHTGRPVVLLAWRQNAGVYPPGIERVADLRAAARLIIGGGHA